MASPLTVCVVVLGKHVPGLAFVGMVGIIDPLRMEAKGHMQPVEIASALRRCFAARV